MAYGYRHVPEDRRHVEHLRPASRPSGTFGTYCSPTSVIPFGDSTVAAKMHTVQAAMEDWSGMTTAEVLGLYEEVTGFTPGED